MNKEFGDGLNQAVAKAFTRPAPKSAGAQMRYLVKQYKGTKTSSQLVSDGVGVADRRAAAAVECLGE